MPATGPEGHVFISYAHEDVERADQLEAFLKVAGISCWRDRELDPGKFRDQIVRKIRESAVFAILVSKHSIGSEWVTEELSLARDGHRTIVPICVDDFDLDHLDGIWALTRANLQFFSFSGQTDRETLRLISRIRRLVEGPDKREEVPAVQPSARQELEPMLGEFEWPATARFHERLLVVDQDPSVVNIFVDFFGDQGYELQTASTSTAALALIRAEEFDLILTDINLPEVDGLEVVRTAKRRNPETCVLVITGQAALTTALEAIHSGASDFIMKPFDLLDVSNIVERTLRGKRLSEENRRLVAALTLTNEKLQATASRLEQSRKTIEAARAALDSDGRGRE